MDTGRNGSGGARPQTYADAALAPEASHKPYVVVVGGANVDIAGMSDGPLVPLDSNLGSVRISHGGVGRNIAHNLALLGVDVRFITVFGDDISAQGLKAGCVEAGIDISHSIDVPGASSSTYLFIADENGEMQLAINDMSILEHLSFEHLKSKLDLMRGAAVCVIDTNLPRRTLEWLTSQEGICYFCDPISTVKASKLDGLLAGIHTLKPNLLEARLLAGAADGDDRVSASPEELASRLLDGGLERVFISLGPDGLYCADTQESCRLGLDWEAGLGAQQVVNTTGAGDAMMAALVWAHLEGLGLYESARAGMAASAICVEHEQTVSPKMSLEYLKERMSYKNEEGV